MKQTTFLLIPVNYIRRSFQIEISYWFKFSSSKFIDNDKDLDFKFKLLLLK